MNIALNKNLKRHWLFVLYLIWTSISILLFTIPHNAFYLAIYFLGWCVLGLIVLGGSILYKFADAPWVLLALLSLPLLFFVTFRIGGMITTSLHRSAVEKFIQEIQESGFSPANYQLSNQNGIRSLKTNISDYYTIKFNDFLLGEYIFIVQFDNDIAYRFDIRRPENVSWMWNLSFSQKS